jgi:hypothetical protein
MGDVRLPLPGVGHGEIVPDAGAADVEAGQEGAPLDRVDVRVGGRLGVPGEVVAGGVDGVEAQLRAEVEHLLEGDLPAAEGGVEGVQVAAEPDLRGAGASGQRLRACPRGGGGEVGQEARGGGQGGRCP